MPTRLPATADAVILGGGVMGASTAYHLCKAGIQKVVLLEREPFFGTGATGRCAGGIRYQFNTEINIRLSQISLPMLDALEEETGISALIRKCGYLFVLTREIDVEHFQKTVELQNRLGVSTEWLDSQEVRKLAQPCFFEDALAGCINREDGLADPHSVVSAYINAAKRLGASCVTECNVTGIEMDGEHIAAVQTNQGSVSTRIVVNACGPWSQKPASWVGLELPVKPLRRQWLVTEGITAIPESFPFVIDFAQSLYFHSEGPGILTGMSNPHEKFGEDQSIDPLWEENHIEKAIQRMPLLGTTGIKARQAGLYEVTPDAHPIVGKTPVDGFYVVTGFSGHGFMHGPVCGMLISELISEGHTKSLDISELELDRFENSQLNREYNVI